jgi:cobalt-precorrin-5B (C1)-methyltransferase
MGFDHVSGATGSTSEAAAQKFHRLEEVQLIDMGDFAGGMLKYLRDHPVARVTIAGGVAKMTKLAQGMLDLHSKRGAADLDALASVARSAGASAEVARSIHGANTVAEAFASATAAGVPLGETIAEGAWQTAASVLERSAMSLEILIFDRQGNLMGQAPFRPVHDAPRPLKRR